MKNRKAQFQGSKANARKQAFLVRTEKRKQNRMLPVVVANSARHAIAPYSILPTPVLSALINPIMSDVVYKDKKQASYLLLGV